VRSGGNEETRERESRVWGIGAFIERERRGQREGEINKEREFFFGLSVANLM
jgi:hypothetical protein